MATPKTTKAMIELAEPNVIETQNTDTPVCPYCYTRNGTLQLWGYETTMICRACKRDFSIMTEKIVAYSTATLEINE